MAAILEIDDGTSAWWESPDIWVVPGNDPFGRVGTPVVGEPAYVWARVHNRGDVDVMSARVDFWWSNPAAGVTRSLSAPIGSAFVDLAAGATEEVLCLSAWVPTFVNSGHECLVSEVISGADPLPKPLPDMFEPVTYHQIAQRNLSVLETAPMVLSLQIGADRRSKPDVFHLRLETGGELDEAALLSLGLHDFRPARQPLASAGLSHSASCGAETSTELDVRLTSGRIGGTYVHIEPNDNGSKGTYTLLRIYQDRHGNAPGITYVLTGGQHA